MSDLDDLYQEVILGHYKSPRNFRALESANRTVEGFNPFCGNRITVYLDLQDETIRDIGFQGSGCAICTASASLMTESVKGKDRKTARDLHGAFQGLVMGKPVSESGAPALGKLEVFSGVSQFPIRIKCATLPWHALRAAMDGEDQTVTTE